MKKLVLKRETIRPLTAGEADRVAGGLLQTVTCDRSVCQHPPCHMDPVTQPWCSDAGYCDTSGCTL